MSTHPRLKAVLVGCGGMGRGQAKTISQLPEFELAGVCDIVAENLQKTVEATGAKPYTDFGAMLEAEKPAVVAICTHNTAHAPQTIQAAKFPGVRGIYCEKPMAVNMAEAREMVRICREKNVVLVINHQRRLSADLLAMRQAVQSGLIGQVRVIRGMCAGDVLSDGTHLVDSIQWITGDQPADWVVAQIHRQPHVLGPNVPGAKGSPPGTRFGHVVESGGMTLIRLRDGTRIELHTGDLIAYRSPYQDYEIIGTKGRIWRTGDIARPNLFIQDGGGGAWVEGRDQWMHKPVPAPQGTRGDWRPLDLPGLPYPDGIPGGYQLFARAIHEGVEHPMSGDNALRGFEIVMAIYESARLNSKVSFPLRQERFPLELMIEEKHQPAAFHLEPKTINAVACSTSAFKMPLDQALATVRRLGFENVDLIAIPGWDHIDTARLANDFDAESRRIDALLRLNQLKPIAMNMALGTLHDRTSPEQNAQRLKQAEAVARLMNRLGISFASFYPGYRADKRDWEQVLADEVATIKELVGVAARHGVVFGVELHAATPFETVEQGTRLLSAIPELKVAYDPSHYAMQGIDLKLTEPLIARAAQVHLRDAAREKMQTPTGRGVVDFDWIHGALKRTGYHGGVSIEYLPGLEGGVDPSILALKKRVEAWM
jgi:predicted dehydrogenase/sugar phosphate isomerase/epimerase